MEIIQIHILKMFVLFSVSFEFNCFRVIEATTMERVAGPQVGNGHLPEKANGSNGHKANGSNGHISSPHLGTANGSAGTNLTPSSLSPSPTHTPNSLSPSRSRR